ncbi:hypothetical protein [Nostoc sp.]|uniref:hypothetical protein n=1 Tax=Nostoc sp. TaxID=1180 RepID=UPI002FFB59AB
MLIRTATTANVPAVLPMVAKICAFHESWDSAKYAFLAHPEQRYEQWLIRLQIAMALPTLPAYAVYF